MGYLDIYECYSVNRMIVKMVLIISPIYKNILIKWRFINSTNNYLIILVNHAFGFN